MSHRIERVNNLIRREVSMLLQRQVKDPRLGSFVAVTEVSTSHDLRHAKIFISCLGNKEKKQEKSTSSKPSPQMTKIQKSLGHRSTGEAKFKN